MELIKALSSPELKWYFKVTLYNKVIFVNINALTKIN